ncbi:MAG: DUF1092 family protein [Alkalinema sp. RU_4_3]|nr:DUF1092 family protein [Alkalinema sp. RU_4_3]
MGRIARNILPDLEKCGSESRPENKRRHGRLVVQETGVLDRWTLTPLPLPELQLEATRFESDKAAVRDVHFLALQESPDVEAFAGFWMLRDVSLM